MKNKALVSMLLTLVMIASSFVIGVGADDTEQCGGLTVTSGETYPFGQIIKEVWNGTDWVDETEADVGDTLTFRITIIYEETDHPDSTTVRNVTVNDTLPNCLEYANNANIEPDSQSGKTIQWKFPGPYFSNDSGACVVEVIEFDANVTDTTDEDGEDNFVEVEGLEKCSSRHLYGNATATVIVFEEECGDIEITKKVWNGTDWVDFAVVEHGIVLFNITITYNAGCGFVATDIVVIDTVTPNGLSYEYVSSNFAPSLIDGNVIQWNLTEKHDVELSDGESVSIELELNLTDGYDTLRNCAEVEAMEHCCGCPLCGVDCASVEVEEEPCVPEIEVIKKVWNGTAWTEFVGDLKLGDTVKFKIDIIWHACDGTDILNLIVRDDLPYCLDYLDTISFDSNAEYYSDPQIDPAGRIVYWNWTYNSVILEDGDYITIIFTTTMERYCDNCECVYFNCVNVTAAACPLIDGEDGKRYYGDDCAEVDCTPPEPEFHKKAWNVSEWVDEIHVKQGDTIKFQLKLDYYGEEDLEEIQFVDILPCILEYVQGSATISHPSGDLYIMEPMEPEISENGKTLWWNLTETLEDGKYIKIEFDALVTGTTGDCDCGDAINYAYVQGRQGCVQEPNFFMDDEVIIRSGCPSGNCPPSIPVIRGPETGETGEELTFHFLSVNPDGNDIYYSINFGDGEVIGYGPVSEGVEQSQSHTYDEPGTYLIKAEAEDEKGLSSGWTPAGYEFEVVITEEPNETKKLSVTMGILGFGKVKATVKNVGEVDLSDIDWEINGTGGILSKVSVLDNDTIESLETGKSVGIEASTSGRGIGRLSGKVKLVAGDYEKTQEFNGFVLGKLVIIR